MTSGSAVTLAAIAWSALVAGTLREAAIRITVEGNTARVTARYLIAGAGDSLRLNAIRARGQRFSLEPETSRPSIRLDTLPGLLRLVVPRRADPLEVELHYRVTGDLARIPIFVPEAPAAPGQSAIEISIVGVPPRRAGAYVFPRFVAAPGGVWRARPEHVPSFVVIAGPSAALSVPGLAQWSVVVIALAGTAAWLVVQLRARRRPPGPGR